ncbi:hypothetical protein D3C72_688410 [compost metagenome]
MINFRLAKEDDINLLFEWANEESTRINSYNTEKIDFVTHSKWLESQLKNPESIILIFESGIKSIGQVRFNTSQGETVIGITIDKAFRGQSMGSKVLVEACNYYHSYHPDRTITAYIKKDNVASIHSFQKAGFTLAGEKEIKGCPSMVYIKTKELK